LPVAKGDFILIDYTTKIKETGETFDTTSADEAKKSNIFKENARYEPMLVVVGESWVLKGLDDSLVGLEPEKQSTIEVPPEQAFGPRDPSKIRMIPAARFRRQDIRPYPGAEIEIEGRSATVRAVGAGRVQVDFNPPLAGKTLVYELVVKKTITEREEKVQALIHRRIPNVDLGKFKLTLGEEDVSIEVPEEATYLEGVEAAKKGLATDIQNFLSDIEKVVFTEVFLSQKPDQVPSQQEPVQANGSEGTQSSP
jgi:peptidylprolyl isomerase